MRFLCFILISFIHCSSSDIRVDELKNDVFATLSTGSIRGRIIKTAKNNSAYAFQGVPYAEPPLGQLRFQLPIPKKPWNGTLNCTDYGAACMSNSSKTTSPQSVVSEDCLTLNIFMGVTCTKSQPCPITLYIHGGGWSFDSPRMFPPEYIVDNLASKGIVVILVGYRLGSFGFWTTGDAAAPGNYGIRDIIHSLRWIQSEVGSFGGDPSKVTIMGHSSAGTGVTLLTLSPLSEGLFQQAIPMSGSGIEAATLSYSEETNRLFAIRAGCATADQWSRREFQSIIECLRSKDGHELLLVQRKLDDENYVFLGPRMDGPGGVFPAQAPELAKQRKPHTMMTGTTLNEFGPVALQLNATKDLLAAGCAGGAKLFGFTNIQLIAAECTKAYGATGRPIKAQIGDLVNDMAEFVPTYKDAATMRDSGAKVYLYSFDYVKRGMEGIGPFHAQDLTYIFGIHPFTFDSRDYQIAEIYPKLFSDFIKHGNPTPQLNADQAWQPLRSPTGYNYYSIDLPQPSNKPLYHFNGVQFWTVTAPSIDLAARQQPENPDSTNKAPQSSNDDVVDWETAFWITLVLGVVCLIGLLFLIGIQWCAKRNFQKHYSETMEDPTENTGLLSSSSGSGNNNGKKSYI